MLVLDFETRSRCDLISEGTDKYVSHPSTDILCMGAIDMETGQEWLWYPHNGLLPHSLYQAIINADYLAAHHARFDQGIWECVAVDWYKFPEMTAEKWYCTMAQCRVNAMPAALDKVTRALGTTNKKDFKGAALIRKLSIPNKKTGEFNEDPVALREMGAYCMKDVRATVDVIRSTRLMTVDEHEDWLINERINDRGVRIDRQLALNAQKYAHEEATEIAYELQQATDYAVEKHTQSTRMRDWLIDQLPEDHPAIKMMVVYKKGEKKYSLAKDIRANILNAADEHILDIPDNVYNAISLMDDGNKSSVAKFKRMIDMATEDDRVRGAFVYAGASQTLRYASRGLQLHNMRRDCWDEETTAFLADHMRRHTTLTDLATNQPLPVMDTLSKLLRPALIPDPGKLFVVGDWSAIEARGLPWLANSEDAERKLDIFRRDEDVYIATAAEMGLTDRQLGKVCELALGYGGAKGAFAAMGRIYGVYLPDNEIDRLVKLWRRTNPWAEKFWNTLETAAMNAVKWPGEIFQAGRVKYLFASNLIEGTLLCLLPGDIIIQYPKARIEVVEKPWGMVNSITALKANWTPAADAKEWPRVQLWRGLLAENATQALCAGLLRNSIKELDQLEQPVIAHVHDEIVLEVDEVYAAESSYNLKAVMEEAPDWAYGLPLKVKPTIMRRYGK